MLLNCGVGEDSWESSPARRSNHSILKEISPEHSLEGLILKLKLQYFGHVMPSLTHWKRPRCWERLKAGEEDSRGWDGWMPSPTWWTWVWVNSGSWRWTGRAGILQSMGSQGVGYDWATKLNGRKFLKNKKQSANNFGGENSYREIKSRSLFCWSWQSSWGNMKQRWIKHKSKLSRQWHRSCVHIGMIYGPRSSPCCKCGCVRRPRKGKWWSKNGGGGTGLEGAYRQCSGDRVFVHILTLVLGQVTNLCKFQGPRL